MARTVRDATLDTRAARSRLAARGKPHYRVIEEGLHLGYRKSKGRNGKPATAGKWVVRFYVGKQTYAVETIATADDTSDANGVTVLSFTQAQAEARKRRDQLAHSKAGRGHRLTVEGAINAYVNALKAKGKNTTDSAFRAQAMIIPALGKIDVGKLTTDEIRHWLTQMADTPPRLRTAKGEPQRYRSTDDSAEAIRRRRSTANRILAILKAALSHAYREKHVASDEAWRRVEAFEDVAAARIQLLEIPEAQRLLNACNPDFRNIVHAGLLTGCRYGELGRLTVSDFKIGRQTQPDGTSINIGTITVQRSKTGKSRHVVLTEEGVEFFKQLCAGRPGDDILLKKPNGAAWGKSHQIPEMVDACKRANIKPAVSFHGLRHTYASLCVMNGTPLMVVAKNLGHADTRMVEKHYGHMSASYFANAIMAGAPRFGFEPEYKVATLGQ